MAEKVDPDLKHLEIVLESTARARAVYYEPRTDEERALDKRVNMKLDLVVVSLLSVMFIFCGIDKTNIGFVATSSFVKDVNLNPDAIPNSLSLFSATYVPLQPVMAVIARRAGVKWFIGMQLIVWGGISMAHAAVRGGGDLIALRLVLGAAEAGFTQICTYYMSTLYPKYAIGFRVGVFTGMYSVAGAFAGLLAYGLLRIESGALHGWQIVYLVEGGVTLALGILAFFVLPGSLSHAWFLSEAERSHAISRMEIDLAGTQEEADVLSTHVTRRDIVDVLTDWKKLCIVVLNVTTVLPVSAFTTFLPLIVQGMGYTGIEASLMSVPPFVVGAAGLVLFVKSSDHFRERSLHTIAGLSIGTIGLVVMAVSVEPKLRYGFTHVCMAGVFVGGALLAVWLANNTPWKGSRSVILGVNGWSNIAGVIAGQIFKSQYAPRYTTPLIITMCIMAFGIAGLGLIRFLYILENKKRSCDIASWDEQRFLDEANSTVRRGDQRRTFMYSL